ncbi:hypothetical protein H6G94_33195 [Nostoc punctiforme FACHB-252]|uniref:Uncharacterized protein n=1 Tax=Nostoc punctiforme FACHB-252 TaxID=1357509 RepID=A0ABR8HLU9_NOSPU|nr:hypothetical protein [Nostoc punctiforme]MBD2616045.1 hypothetical protein [Nostoc punctiforme FACHB-252]
MWSLLPQVLEYRQQQREERERRREEERERNEAYAARMQAMYGINAPSNPPLLKVEVIIRGGVDGQDNPTHSWWQQVKSYTARLIERVYIGVDAVKEFLSTLTSDERWGGVGCDAGDGTDSTPDFWSIGGCGSWVQWLG